MLVNDKIWGGGEMRAFSNYVKLRMQAPCENHNYFISQECGKCAVADIYVNFVCHVAFLEWLHGNSSFTWYM